MKKWVNPTRKSTSGRRGSVRVWISRRHWARPEGQGWASCGDVDFCIDKGAASIEANTTSKHFALREECVLLGGRLRHFGCECIEPDGLFLFAKLGRVKSSLERGCDTSMIKAARSFNCATEFEPMRNLVGH